MIEFGISRHLVKLTELTMSKVECKIRMEINLLHSFNTNGGLRQGDALSCVLFNIALEKVIHNSEVHGPR